MGDDRASRDKQAHDEVNRQRPRELEAEPERGDEPEPPFEPEPPVEPETLAELERDLSSIEYPATGAEVVAAGTLGMRSFASQREASVKTFEEHSAIGADDDGRGIETVADWLLDRIDEKGDSARIAGRPPPGGEVPSLKRLPGSQRRVARRVGRGESSRPDAVSYPSPGTSPYIDFVR